MFMFVFWIGLAALVGFYASSRGRSGIGWFLLALLISPLIAFVIVAVVPPNSERVEARELSEGTRKKCPYCAELVRVEAQVCKHCGRELASESG